MFTVMVSEKDGPSETLNFDKTEVSIGRVKGNDIVLPKGNVSKRHSRIVVKDGKFIVVDLKSTNGTYVNGRKITSPQVIKSADKVYIGDFVLSVVESGADAAPGPPPAPGGPSSDIQPLGGGGLPPSVAGAGNPPGMPGGMPPGPPSTGLPPVAASRPSSPSMPAAPAMPPAPSLDTPKPIEPVRRTPTMAAPNLGNLPGPTPRGPASSPGLPGPGAPNPALGATAGLPNPAARGPASSPGLPGPTPRGPASSPGLPGPGAPGGGLPGPTPRAPVSPGSMSGPTINNAAAASVSGSGFNTPPRPVEPVGDMGPPPPGASSAVRMSPGLAMATPGASAIPPTPTFVAQYDDDFAAMQGQAAEAFFGSIDPQSLPMYYPARPEDRGMFEATVHDIAARLGAGTDLAEHLLNEAISLGPLENLLDDESVEEIYVNSYDQILYKQGGQVVAAARAYSHPEFLFLAAQRLLSARVEDSGELADEVRFNDGTRVHILMPPLAPRGPVLTVRKARAVARSLDELVQLDVMSEAMAETLTHAVAAGRSVVVAGNSDAARATILNAMADLIPEGTRIMAIENVSTMRLSQQSAVYMEEGAGGRNRYGMRYLIQAAMRMRPERLIVNSLTGPEAYDWVSAACAGTFGSMASCAGTDSHDALARLQTLCQLGAPDLNPRALREQVARAAHVVVVVHQMADGVTRVHQISEVQGVDLDGLRVQDVFYHRAEVTGGHFVATGYVPMFVEALRNAGVNVDTRTFNP